MTVNENLFKVCKFRPMCKSQQCSFKCYPFTFLHGIEGKTGLWKTKNVPKRYDHCKKDNLPKIEPAPTRTKMIEFMERVLELIDKGVGLYLFSIPSKENPMGTGTGKTTVATSILNEFLVQRAKQHLTGMKEIKTNPALFMEMSDFQNIYNAQFRGNRESQERASEVFYRYKDRMKTVELLVVDDIAMRNSTEAFTNELYEIINHRVNEGLSTIYTSNEPLANLTDLFGERIVSRIDGSTFSYPFIGKDHRRKDW